MFPDAIRRRYVIRLPGALSLMNTSARMKVAASARRFRRFALVADHDEPSRLRTWNVGAYDSRTKGNVGTEIVKYFLQLHYGIKEDFRNFDLLERGNFYDSN